MSARPENTPLRILVVEDTDADAELMEKQLRRDGIVFTMRRVEDKSSLANELTDFAPNIVLVDLRLPSLDGNDVIDFVREHYPDLPVVVVSGTIGEQLAVETLKRGAADYVLKNNLVRLSYAVKRTLAEADERSRRKRAEAALSHREKMDAIGHLAGGVAHDFNNHLVGIMGFAELLVEKIDDPELKGSASNILSSAARAAELTRQLLAFSRKGKFLNAPVDVHEVIAEVVAYLQRNIDKRIMLKQELEAASTVVLGDPTQIRNILLNLAVNAAEAMPDGGCITLATDLVQVEGNTPDRELLTGKYIRIDVIDTGNGMDETTMKRLFEPFFSTKEIGKGTGLGLASAYGAVQNHGGTILVQSKPGKGSTFSVLLPVHAMPLQITPDVPQVNSSAPANPHGRIMIVDDSASILEITAKMLRNEGYDTLAYLDPVESLEAYRNDWRRIDLVIFDYMMPRMSGRDLYQAMRVINPSVKTILISGYCLDDEAQEIIDMGVRFFIQKPFQKRDLLQKINDSLGT